MNTSRNRARPRTRYVKANIVLSAAVPQMCQHPMNLYPRGHTLSKPGYLMLVSHSILYLNEILYENSTDKMSKSNSAEMGMKATEPVFQRLFLTTLGSPWGSAEPNLQICDVDSSHS